MTFQAIARIGGNLGCPVVGRSVPKTGGDRQDCHGFPAPFAGNPLAVLSVPGFRWSHPLPDPLIAAALAARLHAFAPFSKFLVGAAIEDSDGRIHTGCNVENATYGLTLCAERVAVFKAISEGVRKFRRVAVAADTDNLTPPCGACRQILWEFCGDVELVLVNLHGKTETYRLKVFSRKPFDASYFYFFPLRPGAGRRTGRLYLERALRDHDGRAAPRDPQWRGGHQGRSHPRGRHEIRDRRALPGEAAPGPSRRHPGARADQYPYARRDEPFPRHRRRSEVAGLAREIYLPRREKERHGRFRALGHAPGVSRNAALRHHHVHRYVLLRGRGGRSRQGGGHARRARRDHHRLPGGRHPDSRRCAGLHGTLPEALSE